MIYITHAIQSAIPYFPQEHGTNNLKSTKSTRAITWMSVTGNYKLLNVKLQLELKQSLSFYSRKSPHHLPLNPHGPLSNTELKSALSIQFK